MEAIHTTIGQGGRVVIPAFFRERYGIAEGDEVVLRCDDAGIHIATADLALATLQNIAKRRLKKKKVVDSFLAQRRAEAKRD